MNRIVISNEDDEANYLTKEQRLEELRDKLNAKSRVKVSLDVNKVNLISRLNNNKQTVGSDYMTMGDTQSTAENGKIAFKKVKKNTTSLLKKRHADEDIISVLEKAN